MPSDGASDTENVNPLYLAHSRLRRRRFDDTISICSDVLNKNPLDQQAWFLKVRATTLKNWVDDTELEEEGVFSRHAVAVVPVNGLQVKPRILQELVTSCWRTMQCNLLLGLAPHCQGP